MALLEPGPGERARRAQDEIERVIVLYRGLEEITPDFIFIIDRELLIRYVNKAAARLLKRQVREVIGKYLEMFFPRHVYGAQFQRIEQVLQAGITATSTGPVSFGRTELLLNTKWVPISCLSGMVCGVVCIARDISELRPPAARAHPADEAVLSGREMQVLTLVAKGKTNKEIGQELFISAKTVDVHRTNMMKKLDAHNTAELILKSRQTGLLV